MYAIPCEAVALPFGDLDDVIMKPIPWPCSQKHLLLIFSKT